jgi:hypothetical protein
VTALGSFPIAFFFHFPFPVFPYYDKSTPYDPLVAAVEVQGLKFYSSLF